MSANRTSRRVEVDAAHRGLVHGGVRLVVEQVAQRVPDRGRLQQVGGDLVQERLERVVVVLVDDRDVDVGVLELAGGADAPEAAAEDEHVGTARVSIRSSSPSRSLGAAMLAGPSRRRCSGGRYGRSLVRVVIA